MGMLARGKKEEPAPAMVGGLHEQSTQAESECAGGRNG